MRHKRYGPNLTIALITIFPWILLFWLIVESLKSKGIFYYLDFEVQRYVRELVNPSMRKYLISIIKSFDRYFIISIPGVLLLFLLLKKALWKIIAFLLSIGGGAIMIIIMRKVFRGWSPISPMWNGHIFFGFPSGHACYAMVVFGFVVYLSGEFIKSNLLKSIIVLLCASLIILMGIILIFVSYHRLSDVLGGYCAGLSWLLISILLTRTIKFFWEGEY